LNLFEATSSATSRTSDFSGRSRRSEFWLFYLAIIIATILVFSIDVIFVLAGAYGFPIFGFLVELGTFIPLVACNIRRMHDVDRSGWWMLVPLAGVYFLFIDGTHGNNRFGSDPKAG
jgi:uncharacterized membrane protein YhaH (DUF805 family)